MPRPLLSLTVIALVEGVALVGMGVYDALLTPAEGASTAVGGLPGRALQVALFLAFGAGMVLVSRAWQKALRWARAPFIVAQIIGLAVGVPLVQDSGTLERAVGIVLCVVALAGIILSVSPPVTRELGRQR